MATAWTKQPTSAENINNGYQYEAGDFVSVEALNAIVNTALYVTDRLLDVSVNGQ